MNDPTPAHRMPVAVIGAGSWGTALAALLAGKLPEVTLWCREPEVADGINSHGRNPFFVSDLDLPRNIRAVTGLAEAAASHRTLVMVVPTQFTRAILASIRAVVSDETVFVSASKGIEVETLTLISEMYAQVLGAAAARRACFLSGPSFAREVILGNPTAVAIAGSDQGLVREMQELFFTPCFRTYGTDDVIGLELGGALKNVIALAAGISDGLNYGHSARAALITRGLSEIVRLGVHLGARPETFSGLSGVGDLMLTASSELSRNRTVGFRLGRGESLEAIQRGFREVAEGVRTTLSVHRLAVERQVEMPITRAVYGILYEGRSPASVVTELMERDLKREEAG